MEKRLLLLSSLLLFAPSFAAEQPISELVFDPGLISQKSLRKMAEIPSTSFTRYKNPFIAVGLSMLLPGLGHAYLEDVERGTEVVDLWRNSQKGGTPILSSSFNSWQYNVYAAYRDVRVYNKQNDYFYDMPIETYSELLAAPFQASIMKKPEVWGGILCNLAAAFILTALVNSAELRMPTYDINPFEAFPIGVGEECLFRGFLQPHFSEYLTPYGGIFASSLVFGAAHIPNAYAYPKRYRKEYYRKAIPQITAAGAYFGWLTYKNNSLKESVAVHAWYDFTLFLLSTVSSLSLVKEPSFCLSIPF